MTVINPFDFFVEEYADNYPFEYDKQLARWIEARNQSSIFLLTSTSNYKNIFLTGFAWNPAFKPASKHWSWPVDPVVIADGYWCKY